MGSRTESSSTKWSELLRVQGKELAAIRQGGLGIGDDELYELAEVMKGSGGVPHWRGYLKLAPQLPLALRELDVGQNRVGNAGVAVVAAALQTANVYLRVLKLHKNLITDMGALAIAGILENASGKLAELHLSHNLIRPAGADVLLDAAAKRPEYPFGGAPLWLRMEMQQDSRAWAEFHGSACNRVEVATRLVGKASTRMERIRLNKGWLPSGGTRGPLICMIARREDSCKPGCCRLAHVHGPVVHLPYFWRQGTAVPQARDLPESVPAAVAISGGPLASSAQGWSYTAGQSIAAVSPGSEHINPLQEDTESGWPASSHERWSHHTGSRVQGQEQHSCARAAGSFRRRENVRCRVRQRDSPQSGVSASPEATSCQSDVLQLHQKENDQTPWSCQACTFVNEKPHGLACELCNTHRYLPSDEKEISKSSDVADNALTAESVDSADGHISPLEEDTGSSEDMEHALQNASNIEDKGENTGFLPALEDDNASQHHAVYAYPRAMASSPPPPPPPPLFPPPPASPPPTTLPPRQEKEVEKDLTQGLVESYLNDQRIAHMHRTLIKQGYISEEALKQLLEEQESGRQQSSSSSSTSFAFNPHAPAFAPIPEGLDIHQWAFGTQQHRPPELPRQTKDDTGHRLPLYGFVDSAKLQGSWRVQSGVADPATPQGHWLLQSSVDDSAELQGHRLPQSGFADSAEPQGSPESSESEHKGSSCGECLEEFEDTSDTSSEVLLLPMTKPWPSAGYRPPGPG